MTSVSDWTAHADQLRLRSSVASKRFPLSNEQLARFRFARVQFARCGRMGPIVPTRICGADHGFAWTKGWRL